MRTLLVAMAFAMSCSAQDITFTNRTASFTNLEGHVFSNITLSHADLDGVIWRSDRSAGRICFTNLSPKLLESWSIPTNRIQIAAERASERAARSKMERSAAAQRALTRKIESERAYSERAQREQLDEARQEQQEKLDQIDRLRAELARDKVLRNQAWDRYKWIRNDAFSVTINSRGGSVADTAATRRAIARAMDDKLREHKDLLKELEAAYREKYQERPRKRLP
jgi:hypothetical protein